MTNYLLLFFSTMLLLFGIQKSGSHSGFADLRQDILSKSCSYSSQGLKKACAKKCLKHQTHSNHKGDANAVTDCGPQTYAVIIATEQPAFYVATNCLKTITSGLRQHLAPYLETEHAPPRLS